MIFFHPSSKRFSIIFSFGGSIMYNTNSLRRGNLGVLKKCNDRRNTEKTKRKIGSKWFNWPLLSCLQRYPELWMVFRRPRPRLLLAWREWAFPFQAWPVHQAIIVQVSYGSSNYNILIINWAMLTFLWSMTFLCFLRRNRRRDEFLPRALLRSCISSLGCASSYSSCFCFAITSLLERSTLPTTVGSRVIIWGCN